MSYTITFTPKDIGRNLTRADILKADTLAAGLLEQVLDDLISWHDVQQRDIARVLDYISLEYGHILICIESEYHHGYMCDLSFVCAIQL